MTFRQDAFSHNGLAGAGSSNALGPVGGNTLGFQRPKPGAVKPTAMPLVPAVKPATPNAAAIGLPKMAKSVCNDSDGPAHWGSMLKKLRIRVRNDNGDLATPDSDRFNDAIHETLKSAGVTSELVITFVKTAGDKLTKEACETAIQILPDGPEKTQLQEFVKVALLGSALRLGKTIGPAVASRGGGMGGMGAARGAMNTIGNMAFGSAGMGAAGYGVDTLTGMAGVDTNFGTYGALAGAGAGIPGVRNMLLRGARHLDGKGIASTPYAAGPFNQFTSHNITKGNKGVVSGLVKNIIDPWRTGSPMPSSYSPGVGGRTAGMVETASRYLNPAHNWNSLSPVSKGGRILGGVGAVGLTSESVAKPLMGYNPLKPAEAGKYHAMKALDQKAQEFGYASAAEFENSPIGAGMKAYGKGGLLAAASAAWNAMPEKQRHQLLATVGGGTALLGALAAGASGNYGLAAGLGAAGAAGIGYGMLGPRTGFQQLQAATPDVQQNIQTQLGNQFGADQWQRMTRPQQDAIVEQLMQQAAGGDGQNELARAGG